VNVKVPEQESKLLIYTPPLKGTTGDDEQTVKLDMQLCAAALLVLDEAGIYTKQ
jgi:hypothetical protein|tara:strand:+ start:1254 stop:1415 length:162 start_codon:yes stop_codon:yes gene_type:complete